MTAREKLATELWRGNLGRAVLRAWRNRAAKKSRSRVNDELARAQHRSRALGRCFAVMAHAWARKVLLRAFVVERQRREVGLLLCTSEV